MGPKRFEVIDYEAAKAAGLDAYGEDRRYLIEHMPDGTVREVGYDRGEPEDNSFGRDWGWVTPELNKLAAEAAEWKAKYEALLPK